MQIIIASASHDERARVVPPLSRNIQLTRTTLLYGSRVQKFEIRSQTVLYPISTVASQRISTVRSLPLPTFLFTNPWFPHFPKFQIPPSKISLSLSLSLTLTTAAKKLVDENGVHIGDGERNQEPVRVPWPRLQVLFDELFSRSSQIYLQRQQCRRRALQFGGSHHLQLGRRRHRFRRRIFVHAELRLRRRPFLLERSQCAGT